MDRVAWAVAAHRALIKTIGPGAPAMITVPAVGHFDPRHDLRLQS